MKTLIIKIEVPDDIEAYRVVNRLSFLAKVLEADYSGKKYQFSKEDQTRLPKYFLRDKFGRQEIIPKKL